MEIYILEKKLSVKLKHSIYFVLLTLLLTIIGCTSVHTSDYIAPDYSNVEIRAIEIKEIASTMKDKPVNSLWKAWLLKNTINTNTNIVTNTSMQEDTGIQPSQETQLFNECASLCVDLYIDAVKTAKPVVAARYYSTLQVLAPETLKNISKDDLQSQIDKESTDIFGQTDESEKTNKVSQFITGTVTIWVDLGVKVEKGIGYANRVIGSGFFIRKDGYLITNYHVIADTVDPKYEGYSRVYIKLSSDADTRIPARVVGYDKALDLALLKTEIDAPYVFTLGSSINLDVGDTIYAIGSPVGLTSTITSGIVSSFDRQLLSMAAVMQIDAAVNSGNSGGPLINTNGDVQGIVFAGIPDYEGLNFAIPVEYLKVILPRLYTGDFIPEAIIHDDKIKQNDDQKIITAHEVQCAWSGAYGITYKEPGDSVGSGVQVLYTMPGGSCDQAGIKVGDIISKIDGHAVNSLEQLQNELIKLPPDMVINFTIGNVNKPIYLDVRPEYPGAKFRERDNDWNVMYPLFGMHLIPTSTTDRSQFTINSIAKGSIADESGFSVNDPVSMKSTKVSPDGSYLIAEIYTKKRKSGYLDVNISMGAPMDSSLFF
jgi:S1-C subfamily serine protease